MSCRLPVSDRLSPKMTMSVKFPAWAPTDRPAVAAARQRVERGFLNFVARDWRCGIFMVVLLCGGKERLTIAGISDHSRPLSKRNWCKRGSGAQDRRAGEEEALEEVEAQRPAMADAFGAVHLLDRKSTR